MNRPTLRLCLRGAACVLALSQIAGCGSSVSLDKCPLPNKSAQSISPSKGQEEKAAPAKPINADIPKNVRIYLDGSGSMKGFLAPGAQAPGMKSDPALFKFARLRQTVVALRDALSPAGVEQKVAHFMVFEGDDIAPVRSDDQWRTLTGSDCLSDLDENGNATPKKTKKQIKPDCLLRVGDVTKDAYSGQSLSHKEIISDFLKTRSAPSSANPVPLNTGVPNEDKPDLAVIISDLYSFNNTAPGDVSEILDPLRTAMNQGFSVALVSIWSGFSGRIVDLPFSVKQALGDTYGKHYNGRLPLHLLMVGKAATLRSVLTRLQDRFKSGSTPLEESDINITLFDAQAKPQAIVGDIVLSGANKGEQGLVITSQYKEGDVTYLSASYNHEAEKLEPGKAAKGETAERGLRIGWKPRPDGWWPGDIRYQVSRQAWVLDGGGCKDAHSWSALPDADKTLGITFADNGGPPQLEIFKGKSQENTYAIKLALTVVDSGKPRAMGNWALVEQESPGVLLKALKSEQPAENRLGTLNLDRLIDGLWYLTRDAAHGQGGGGPYPVKSDTIVVNNMK